MSRTFIACHSDGKPGGLNNLKDFLRREGHYTQTLLHPLDDYSKLPTTYENDEGIIAKKVRHNRSVWNYVEDFTYSVKYINSAQFDVFIGCSNFDTLPAIFCRLILRKKISKLIYYPRDYSEDRFTNKLLNKMYLSVEMIACKFSDKVVSNTYRAEKARLKLGLNKAKSVVMPNPVTIEGTFGQDKNIDKQQFVYVGDVSREHGLYDLIHVVSPLVKKLVIIGNGNDLSRTVEYARTQPFELELYEPQSHKFVIDYLRRFGGIGLAPYNRESLWTYYCSPLKVSEYVVCGVPVLMSNVPEISTKIDTEGYGITYDNLSLDLLKQNIAAFDTKHYGKKAKRFYNDMNSDKCYILLGI